MKQRGFIIPSPTMILAGALALSLLATVIQTYRLDSTKKEFELFTIQVKTLGDEQNRKAKEAEDSHNVLVKQKDIENAKVHADLAIVSKRLRDSNSSRSLLPPATDPASSTEKACFNRSKLDNALRDFTGTVGELLIECQGNTIDLDTAKQWVNELKGAN